MTVELIIDEGRLFAPVRLGERSGYAHLDTGARHSSVLQSYAAEYPEVGRREMRAALGGAEVPRARLDEIGFLGQDYQDLVVDVLSDDVGGFAALSFPVLMALGCDVLLRQPLRLDFKAFRAETVNADPARRPRGMSVAAAFEFDLPLFNLHLGEVMLQAIFDTGAGLSVVNPDLLSQAGDLIVQDEPVEVEDPSGARHSLPTVRCTGLRIGGVLLAETRLLALDTSVMEQVTGIRIGLVLGLNAMLGRTWVIDRAGERLEII